MSHEDTGDVLTQEVLPYGLHVRATALHLLGHRVDVPKALLKRFVLKDRIRPCHYEHLLHEFGGFTNGVRGREPYSHTLVE